MRLEFVMALRELRGGLRSFRLFLGCLVVGVSVIAAVGLLAGRVRLGINQEARSLLGGDVEITLTNLPATAEQLEFLQSQGNVSLAVTLRAMATRGEDSTLVELKGVDAQYPLAGKVTLRSGMPLAAAFAGGRIVVGEDLRDRFGVKPGDSIVIGDTPFFIGDILLKEPDHLAGAFSLGARVMAPMDALSKSPLLAPGNLAHYNYRIALASSRSLDSFKTDMAARFPHAPWIIKAANENNRTVQGLLERLHLFLTLAGLSALLIGGVGIRGATESYIAGKAETIATFKSLGAKRGTVFIIYIAVLGFVALLGIAISMVAGWGLCLAGMPYLGRFFPIANDASHDAAPLLLAAGFGFLTVFTFAIAPLARGIEVKPALLFHGGAIPAGAVPLGAKCANLLLAAALVALVTLTSIDRLVAAGFVAATFACFAVFLIAAKTVSAVARHIRLPSGRLRLAVSSLHRPGAPVFSMMLGIGIGLSVLVALLLVEGNIEKNIRESIPAQAPSLFLIDAQPDQKEPLTAFLADNPSVSQLVMQSMVRGRIAQLNHVPVEHAAIADDVKWATESDRGFTYAAAPPEGTRITEGKWWDERYAGPPLLSLDRKLAEGMRLKIGDSVTLNILGQDLETKITSFRDINYLSLRMNFALVLSPGALAAFPASAIATLRVEPAAQESSLVHALAVRFPNVSAIRVRDTLAQFQEIVGHIVTAVRITAIFTLVAGIMVLAATLAAALEKRAFDTVIFKVVGARKRDVLGMFLTEWLIIALITALLSCLFGAAGAWLILRRMDGIPFHLLWPVMVKATTVTIAFVSMVGVLLHQRAFALKPSIILRNE